MEVNVISVVFCVTIYTCEAVDFDNTDSQYYLVRADYSHRHLGQVTCLLPTKMGIDDMI